MEKYSYSKISAYAQCPYGFYMQYMDDSVEQVQNAFASQGSLVHELLDEWAKGITPIENLPSEYVRRYPTEVTQPWPKVLASKGYGEKTYMNVLEYLKDFDGFKGWRILESEYRFETEIGGKLFVGIIDMIIEDIETGDKIILDHKSKSLSSFKSAQDEMYKQQYIYSKAFYEKYGYYPDVLAFHLFKEHGMIMTRPFDMDTYNDTIRWAEDIIEEIESKFFVSDFDVSPTAGDFFCENLCSVRNGCEDWKIAKSTKPKKKK